MSFLITKHYDLQHSCCFEAWIPETSNNRPGPQLHRGPKPQGQNHQDRPGPVPRGLTTQLESELLPHSTWVAATFKRGKLLQSFMSAICSGGWHEWRKPQRWRNELLKWCPGGEPCCHDCPGRRGQIINNQTSDAQEAFSCKCGSNRSRRQKAGLPHHGSDPKRNCYATDLASSHPQGKQMAIQMGVPSQEVHCLQWMAQKSYSVTLLIQQQLLATKSLTHTVKRFKFALPDDLTSHRLHIPVC